MNVIVKGKTFGSSKRFKGFEEINEKKATYAEVIHVDEVDKDHLIGIFMGNCQYVVV